MIELLKYIWHFNAEKSILKKVQGSGFKGSGFITIASFLLGGFLSLFYNSIPIGSVEARKGCPNPDKPKK